MPMGFTNMYCGTKLAFPRADVEPVLAVSQNPEHSSGSLQVVRNWFLKLTEGMLEISPLRPHRSLPAHPLAPPSTSRCRRTRGWSRALLPPLGGGGRMPNAPLLFGSCFFLRPFFTLVQRQY